MNMDLYDRAWPYAPAVAEMHRRRARRLNRRLRKLARQQDDSSRYVDVTEMGDARRQYLDIETGRITEGEPIEMRTSI